MQKISPLIICLVLLFISLQYRILFASDGIGKIFHLKKTIAQEEQKNAELEKRNNLMKSEIAALKKGGTAIEELARNNLGMIKKGETFYQIVD